MTRKKILWSLLLAFTFVACKQKEIEQESKEYQIKGDTVSIVKDSPLSEKIIVKEVEQKFFSKEVVTAGTVQAIPTQYAYIAPPFAGRVTKSYIKLGQKVQVNTPLFEIISTDFTSAQKEFFQAQSQRDLARNELKRKQDLIRNGVGSQKELEEAANSLKIAEKEYENAYSAIKIYQVDPKDMVLGQPLIIRSPIAGEVIENNLVAGQYLSSDSEHVAIVADLRNVWVVAQVKEKDIRFIHPDDRMDINISALPEKPIEGRVYHVGEAIDEDNRSIKVLSVCDNVDGLLRIGMYATVYFLDKPQQYIAVSEKALLQDEKNSYVFVQSAPDTYIKTVVDVDASKDGVAYIGKGLSAGQKIISAGGYYLK